MFFLFPTPTQLESAAAASGDINFMRREETSITTCHNGGLNGVSVASVRFGANVLCLWGYFWKFLFSFFSIFPSFSFNFFQLRTNSWPFFDSGQEFQDRRHANATPHLLFHLSSPAGGGRVAFYFRQSCFHWQAITGALVIIKVLNKYVFHQSEVYVFIFQIIASQSQCPSHLGHPVPATRFCLNIVPQNGGEQPTVGWNSPPGKHRPPLSSLPLQGNVWFLN